VRTLLLLTSALLSLAQSPALRPDPSISCSSCDEWNRPLDPVRVFGNTYSVGTAPGLSNIMVTPTSATSLSAAGVPPGVYYVRTRAVGVAGTGPVSNEVAVVVE
jgi:hypothetical protein